MRAPEPARQAYLIARRELSVEVAGREAVVTALPFVAAALLLAGLGFDARPATLSATAPGLVWLVVLMAAVPLAHGVAAAERHEDCWDLVRAVTFPGSLLAGKLVVLWAELLACWALASLLSVLLLGGRFSEWGVAAGLLGTVGVATLVCAFGALLGSAARRPGLLAVLLLPAGLPALLAGTQLSTVGGPAAPWLALLVAYDAIILAVCWAVFPVLLEE